MSCSKRTGDERSDVAGSGDRDNDGASNEGFPPGASVPEVFSPESEARNCERILGDRRHGLEPDDGAV